MKKLVRILSVISTCLLATSLYAQKIENGQRFRAIVIGIDGMKGTAFHQRVFMDNQAPNIKAITDQGQYSICTDTHDDQCARAHLGPRYAPDYLWLTSSGWAAVLSGMNTDKHLVKDNDFVNQSVFYQTAQKYHTFLYELKQQGFVTAAAGVGNFLSSINGSGDQAHVSPGILDYECGIDSVSQHSSVDANATNSCNLDYRQSFNGYDLDRDTKLTSWMVNLINDDSDKSVDVIMGVYDTVDAAGHAYGFTNNPQYLQAVTVVDADIGQVLNAIQQRVKNNHEAWLIIITSDHGGHLTGHDNVYFDDEVVPMVVSVFGDNISLAKQGAFGTNDVRHMDTAPSVLYWFGSDTTGRDGVVRSEYSSPTHQTYNSTRFLSHSHEISR